VSQGVFAQGAPSVCRWRTSEVVGECAVNDEATEFARSLDEPSRLLLAVRDKLYGGDWGLMEADLEDRLHDRPYIFRLASRIQDDLARLRAMREFEASQHVDLGEYVQDE